MANVINVYIDGACKGNPGGYGGWGWAEFSNKTYIGKEIVFVDCGGCANSTNNKMELEAVIEYLKEHPEYIEELYNEVKKVYR